MHDDINTAQRLDAICMSYPAAKRWPNDFVVIDARDAVALRQESLIRYHTGVYHTCFNGVTYGDDVSWGLLGVS